VDIGNMLRRTFKAAMLNKKTFEEVEHDKSLNREALTVVIIVSILDTIGLLLWAYMQPDSALTVGKAILYGAYGIFGGIFLYLLWAGLTYFIGTEYFGGKADVMQLRRTLGYAQGPRALGVLAFIPGIGPAINWISILWAMIAGIVAVRQALDVTTGKTVAVVLIGWAIAAMIFMMVGFWLGGVGLILLAL
jgi:hypothetical protein